MQNHRETKLVRLINLLDFLKSKTSSKKRIAVNNRNSNYEKLIILITELGILKSNVLKYRYNEARRLFIASKESIKISSFELMEYHFHENSHTNVLQYLFDYRLSGKLGVRILKAFLKEINNESAKSITSLVEKYSYLTERESSIGIGRMDLFIIDSEEKFIIMIENKLLADVSEKEDTDEENESDLDAKITRTQLSNYKEFVFKNYPAYNTLFILLSYKQQDILDLDYITLDYHFLLKVLNKFNEKDNILNEYKLLLTNLINEQFDNIHVLELGNSLLNKQQLTSLTEIQTLKKYFS